MKSLLVLLLVAVLCTALVISQQQESRVSKKKDFLSCLSLCVGLEKKSCVAKCQKPIKFLTSLSRKNEVESDGKFLDWLQEIFGGKKKSKQEKKPAVKPVAPKPVEKEPSEVEPVTPVEKPVVPKPEPIKRTITQEQIWEYFEKMYLASEMGLCNDNKCKLSLPEVFNMSSPQFKFDGYLNSISTKIDQLEPFAKSYEKFLMSLNIPENLEESIGKDETVAQLAAQIQEQEKTIAAETTSCEEKHEKLSRMFPDFETYKERFCLGLKNQVNTLHILVGKLQATRESLLNGWGPALNARKQFSSVPEEYRQTWTKHSSLESIIESAKKGDKSSLSIHFNGGAIKGVQNDHAKSGGEEIYPDIIRVPKDHMSGPELDFDNANKNISNTEFFVEVGSLHFSRIIVQPNSTWFSKAVINQYKNRNEFSEASKVTGDYFFNSKDGALVGYPDTVSVMIQPFVKITVSKISEQYIRKLKRVAVFNFVFDVSEASQDEIISEPCPQSTNEDCVLMTFRKNAKNFDPLLYSVKNN